MTTEAVWLHDGRVSRHANREKPEPSEDARWWYACDEPERPLDPWCVWVWECDACTLTLVAAVQHDPDHESNEYDAEHQLHGRSTVRDTLANVRAWRADQGLRPL